MYVAYWCMATSMIFLIFFIIKRIPKIAYWHSPTAKIDHAKLGPFNSFLYLTQNVVLQNEFCINLSWLTILKFQTRTKLFECTRGLNVMSPIRYNRFDILINRYTVKTELTMHYWNYVYSMFCYFIEMFYNEEISLKCTLFFVFFLSLIYYIKKLLRSFIHMSRNEKSNLFQDEIFYVHSSSPEMKIMEWKTATLQY